MEAELKVVQDDIKQIAALTAKLQQDEAALHLAIRNSVAGVGKQIAADTATPTTTSKRIQF